MTTFDLIISKLYQGVSSAINVSGVKNYSEEPDSWSESFIFGEQYHPVDDGKQNRKLRLDSIPYFCYRYGFSPIVSSSGKEFTSDIGWGCMHRSGQMFAATILQILTGSFDAEKVLRQPIIKRYCLFSMMSRRHPCRFSPFLYEASCFQKILDLGLVLYH